MTPRWPGPCSVENRELFALPVKEHLLDLATIIGFVLGIGLILGAILLGAGLGPFIDIPSILIVVGGTVATTLIMERLENVIGAFKVAKHTLTQPGGDVTKTVKTILQLSATARREGLLALEKVKVDDAFLAKGVRMAVDGLPEDQILETLQAELVSMKQRHTRGQKLFKFMAASAPAMGMIGTLIGLVQMLMALDDPSSIGPSMAVALLTTFYGAIIAFIFCGPIAEKLERRSQEETANMKVVIAGVRSIVAGHNPAIVKDALEARLAPQQRDAKAA